MKCTICGCPRETHTLSFCWSDAQDECQVRHRFTTDPQLVDLTNRVVHEFELER